MGGNLFKTIVGAVILATLAFVTGSLVADGAKVAMAPIALVVGLFVMLCLGRNCWVLIYILPPLISMLQISLVANFPVAYLIAVVVLVYWLLMATMGYVKITWTSLPALDIVTAVFVLYFALTWTWNPVYLNFLVDEFTTEGEVMLGGKAYVWCACAAILYVTMSIIPMERKAVIKLLKWLVWMSIVMGVLSSVIGLVQEGGYSTEDAETKRYAPFYAVADPVYRALLCHWSILGIVCAPWKLVLLLISAFGIAMSGFRSNMMSAAVTLIVSQWFHRRLVILIFAALAGYGTLLYLSSEKMLDDLPYGVKRVLTAVPGVELRDTHIANEAQGSLDWRYDLWRWAMDPSTGYIKDYVWGDGYGRSTADFRLERVNNNRGLIRGEAGHRIFAETGLWHSGWVTAIHRTGYVGLVFSALWMFLALWYITRVCKSFVGLDGCGAVWFALISIYASVVEIYISAGSMENVFGMFFSVCLAKILYNMQIKDGSINPLFGKHSYKPLLIKELDSQ
ncbi:MAG: hypothetical protein IJN29_07300 [Akkermansia sp.]|nr:hypothetical protein [Akkermansia sp.]